MPHPCKIIIAGNHDFGLCNKDGWYEGRGKELHDRYGMPRADTAEVRTLVQEWERGAPQDGMHAYVEDRQIKFDAGGRTWSLYGSPVSGNEPARIPLNEADLLLLCLTVVAGIRRMGVELQARTRGKRYFSLRKTGIRSGAALILTRPSQ